MLGGVCSPHVSTASGGVSLLSSGRVLSRSEHGKWGFASACPSRSPPDSVSPKAAASGGALQEPFEAQRPGRGGCRPLVGAPSGRASAWGFREAAALRPGSVSPASRGGSGGPRQRPRSAPSGHRARAFRPARAGPGASCADAPGPGGQVASGRAAPPRARSAVFRGSAAALPGGHTQECGCSKPEGNGEAPRAATSRPPASRPGVQDPRSQDMAALCLARAWLPRGRRGNRGLEIAKACPVRRSDPLQLVSAKLARGHSPLCGSPASRARRRLPTAASPPPGPALAASASCLRASVPRDRTPEPRAALAAGLQARPSVATPRAGCPQPSS